MIWPFIDGGLAASNGNLKPVRLVYGCMASNQHPVVNPRLTHTFNSADEIPGLSFHRDVDMYDAGDDSRISVHGILCIPSSKKEQEQAS